MGKPKTISIDSKIWIALIVSAILISYCNVYKNEFLFDDLPVIVENGYVKDLSRLSEIFFTSSYTSKKESSTFKGYRPVTTLSFAFNYALHGMSPWGYHLTNVLIHIANSLLVYSILLMLFHARRPAGLIALLFAVHPVNT